MTTCPSCSLDGPCADADCVVRAPVRTMHRCASCSAPFPSVAAAAACARLDADADRNRSRFTD